jgi:hypothetical protein
VVQHLDLAAHARHVRLYLLDLVEQIDQPLALELRLERGDAILELLLDLGQPLAGRLIRLRSSSLEERGAACVAATKATDQTSRSAHGRSAMRGPTPALAKPARTKLARCGRSRDDIARRHSPA